MRKIILIIFNTLLLNQIYSQDKCNFKGVVVDSLENGIYDVSIIAYDTSGKGVGFGYTDKNGYFSVSLPCKKKFEFHFEHFDYSSIVIPVDTIENDEESKKFVLSNNKNVLEEVLINARIPIKVKGDTLEFDAASFQSGNEENLEDVLKNLPGVQVENGKVYYEGKEIKNITVEGREIFGGNMKLVNKNLPSNSISKIQLNKKFKKNPFANSLQNDDDFALNIVLKEDKKNLVFGNITAGTNFKEHSDLQGKAFYFNSKMDATLIGDSNTYGKEVFTREDFMGFLGGISELTREGGVFSLRSNIQPLQLGIVGDAFQTRANLGVVHLGYEPNDKWYINGFVLGTRNTLDYNTTNDRVFDNVTLRQENKELQELRSGLAQMRIDYYLSGKSELKYRAFVNAQENEVNQFVENFSITDLSIDSLGLQEMKINRNFFNFSHNLSYITRVRKNDNFGLYISHNYQKDTPDLDIGSSIPVFDDIFSNQNEENGTYNLRQNQLHEINTLQIYSVYNYLITNSINLKTKLGVNLSSQEFLNDIFSHNLLLSEANQRANAKLSYKEYYGDLTFTKVFGKLKLNIGGSLNKYEDINDILNQENTTLTKTEFLPHLSMKYEWSISKSISLDYYKSFSYPEVRELSNTYQIRDTYSVFIGNSSLNRAINHNFKLRYQFSKVISFFNFYSEFAFNKTENSFQTTSLFNLSTQLNSNDNSSRDANNYAVNLYMDKKFSRIYTMKLKGNFSIYDYYSLTNSDFNNPTTTINLVKNNIVSQDYVLTNNFMVGKKLEFDIGMRYAHNKYKIERIDDSSSFVNRFDTWNPFTNVTWKINKNALFKASYSYEKQTNNSIDLNDFQDLNFSLRYKLFKKTYTTIVAGNLLDSQLVSNSFNSNYSQIVSRNRLGAYYLINFKYKF